MLILYGGKGSVNMLYPRLYSFWPGAFVIENWLSQQLDNLAKYFWALGQRFDVVVIVANLNFFFLGGGGAEGRSESPRCMLVFCVTILDRFRSRTRKVKDDVKMVCCAYGIWPDATPFWRHFHVDFDVRVLDPLLIRELKIHQIYDAEVTKNCRYIITVSLHG
jgi:hypothetical protein